MKFERHPLSAAFPDMPSDEFAALCADIKANGLREPAWILENMVLDGWHRMKACHKVGASFRYERYTGKNPKAFVLSRNLHRRHLRPSERADIVVKVNAWAPVGTNQHASNAAQPTDSKEKQGPPHGGPCQPSMTDAELAAAAQVGERTIQRAKRRAKGEKPPKARPARVEEAKPSPKDLRIAALEAENMDLRAKLSEALDNAAELAIPAEALQLLKGDAARALQEKIAEVARLTRERNDLMNRNAQMQKQLKAVQNKLDKLERAMAKVDANDLHQRDSLRALARRGRSC